MATYRVTSARFVIPIDLYNRDLYVSLGESDERFSNGLLRYKDEDWVKDAVKHMACRKESGVGRFGMNNGFYILRLGVFPHSDVDYSVLQHEIFHCVETMFHAIGIPHHLKYSGEAYAHLVQYLTRELYKRLWTINT